MSPDEYRATAADLRKEAEATKDAAVREQMLTMVADWEKLAEDAAELERRRAAAGA